MADPTTFFATDEDIAIRATGDWPVLAPKDQTDAYGVDGVIAPGAWSLTSASVDFNALGLSANQVVILSQKTAVGVVGPIRGNEEFVVAAVPTVPNTVTLRRKGKPAGSGQPPAMAGASSVVFDCRTLAIQISRATYDIDRQFGIDDMIAGRKSSDMYDALQVRDLCVCMVLYRQYLQMAREGDGSKDVLMAKSRAYRRELDDLMSRAEVKWGPSSLEQNTGKFSMRIGR